MAAGVKSHSRPLYGWTIGAGGFRGLRSPETLACHNATQAQTIGVPHGVMFDESFFQRQQKPIALQDLLRVPKTHDLAQGLG